MKNIITILFIAVLLMGCASSPKVPVIQDIVDSALSLHVPFEGSFTQDAAIERALDSNKEIIMLRADIDIALEQKAAAGDFNDPELRLMYGEDSADDNRYGRLPGASDESLLRRTTADGSRWRAALRIFPANPWMRARKITAADAMLQAKMADLQVAEQQLSLSVKRLLAELTYTKQDMDLLDAQNRVYKDALDNINERMTQGQSTIKDLSSASRRYLGVVSDLSRKERRYRNMRRELARLIDVPLSIVGLANITNSLPRPKPVLIKDDDLHATIIDKRADLMALAWRVAAAESSLKEEGATRIPWFEHLQLSYGSGNSDSQNEPFTTRDDGSFDEWRIDAAISVPVFAWMNNAYDLRRAEYNRAVAELNKSICQAKDNTSDSLEILRETVESYKKFIACTQTIENSMSSLLPGESDSTLYSREFADIRCHILEAERLELAARFDYINAYIDMEKYLYVGERIKNN